MPFPRRALSTALRAAVAGGLLLATSLLRAADGGFTSTLSADQQTAAGLTGLSPAEQAALDRFVAAEAEELRLAGGMVLSGTFVSRRTEAECQTTGLNRLTAAELAKLNELVANAAPSRLKPKERPRLKDDDVISAKSRPELHGSVSFTIGQGGGRTFRGTDLWLSYYIPDYGLSLSVGLSQYSGGFFPFGYYSGYDHWNPVFRGPLLLDTPDRGFRNDDFSAVMDQSSRDAPAWGSVYFSRGRH